MKLKKPTKKQLAVLGTVCIFLAGFSTGFLTHNPVVSAKNTIVLGVRAMKGDVVTMERTELSELIATVSSGAAKEATRPANIQKILNESKAFNPSTGRVESSFIQ